MSQILGVKFSDFGQVYFFSSGPFVVRDNQDVIVKTDQGMGLGKVVLVKQDDTRDGPSEYKPIYRLANEEDIQTVTENADLARDAFRYCRKCIETHGLGMKLVDVEVFFDRGKMIFYFTAPGRIDFRELIKDLVREYRTRIELRQIGVRHETQMLGAMGNCGQVCCCRRFMRKFVPVTIKMAKEQNLFLNPTKISGICGRLLCCLSFEQDGYEEFNRMCPKIGKRYNTTMGSVRVLRSNFFHKSLMLLNESNEEVELPVDEWEKILLKNSGPGQPRSESRNDSRSESRSAPKQPKAAEKPADRDEMDDALDMDSAQGDGEEATAENTGAPEGTQPDGTKDDEQKSSRGKRGGKSRSRSRRKKPSRPAEQSDGASGGADRPKPKRKRRKPRPKKDD